MLANELDRLSLGATDALTITLQLQFVNELVFLMNFKIGQRKLTSFYKNIISIFLNMFFSQP